VTEAAGGNRIETERKPIQRNLEGGPSGSDGSTPREVRIVAVEETPGYRLPRLSQHGGGGGVA
jgi:hypothetical protein